MKTYYGAKGLAWMKCAEETLNGGISRFFDDNVKSQIITELDVNDGDIIFIPAGEKHRTINNSKVDLRYIEFFTNPPLNKDFVAIE